MTLKTVNEGPTLITANNAHTPEVDITNNSPFSNRQSRGKARKKLLTSLPKSPRKRKALIVEFAEIEGLCTVKKAKSSRGSRAVSEELMKKVIDFYTDNEISWQAPGKRDYIIVRENGNKHKVQKKHLLSTLKEAHAMFIKEYKEEISFSKFCELRPKHVLLLNQLPHNVCVCRYHEDIRLLLNTLKMAGLGVNTGFRDFISQVVCCQENKECMYGLCDDCPGLSSLEPNDEIGAEMCTWEKWEGNMKIKQEDTVFSCFS